MIFAASEEGLEKMKRKVYDKMLERKAKYADRYALMLDGVIYMPIYAASAFLEHV